MIRLLIADDWTLFRQGLRALLEATHEFEVVAEVADDMELYEILRTDLRVDVALVDPGISGSDGVELLRKLNVIRSRLPILALATNREPGYAMHALRIGAAGYFTKDSPTQGLIEAIRRLAVGGQYLCPDVAEQVAGQWRRGEAGDRSHPALSARESCVLEMLVQGRTGSQIAAALCLSKKTVSTHKSRLLKKLQARSLADLVRYAAEHKLPVTTRATREWRSEPPPVS